MKAGRLEFARELTANVPVHEARHELVRCR
jgi:hypothetical protein